MLLWLFFPPTVIWVANILSYGLCFHPDSVDISLGNLSMSVLMKLSNVMKVNDSDYSSYSPLTLNHRPGRVWDDSEPWFNTFRRGAETSLLCSSSFAFYSKNNELISNSSCHTPETQTHALSFSSFLVWNC